MPRSGRRDSRSPSSPKTPTEQDRRVASPLTWRLASLFACSSQLWGASGNPLRHPRSSQRFLPQCQVGK